MRRGYLLLNAHPLTKRKEPKSNEFLNGRTISSSWFYQDQRSRQSTQAIGYRERSFPSQARKGHVLELLPAAAERLIQTNRVRGCVALAPHELIVSLLDGFFLASINDAQILGGPPCLPTSRSFWSSGLKVTGLPWMSSPPCL